MQIDASTDADFLKWKDSTPYNPSKGNHDLPNKNEQSQNTININNNMSEELKIALHAWDALYNSEGLFNPKFGHIDNIERWIEKNYPHLPDAGKKRIAKVININKKGGATAINQI